MNRYLKSTITIDCDNPEIKKVAMNLTNKYQKTEEKVKSLFYFVRDKIKYKNFEGLQNIDFFKSSETLKRGYGFCIPKAVLLASFARVVEIPSRLHFVDIYNHKIPEKLKIRLKTNLFTYHAYVELYFNNKWLKLTPALNIELCEKFDILPVEFTGNDALFNKFDKKGKLHIEYVKDNGFFDDLPYEKIITAFKKIYEIE